MNIVRSGRPRVAEFWFDEPVAGRGADLAILRQVKSPPARSHFVQPFQTLVIDLGQEEDQLFGALHKETRQEIRRARDKDLLRYELFEQPTPDCVASFCAAHAHFAGLKRLQAATVPQLMSHADAGSLRLARAVADDGTLVWHSFVAVGGRARGLHSAPRYRPEDRALSHRVGRANRFLHWHNMIQFKQQGHETYDMGGWYAGTSDPALVSVNQFKASFGGTVVTEYNCIRPLSWLGHAYMRLKYGRPGSPA